jgi:hypothetical protein
MAFPSGRAFGASFTQLVPGVLAQGLVQAVPRITAANVDPEHQRLPNELEHRVEHVLGGHVIAAAHRFGGIERPGVANDNLAHLAPVDRFREPWHACLR